MGPAGSRWNRFMMSHFFHLDIFILDVWLVWSLMFSFLCLVLDYSQIFIGAVHISYRGLRRPKKFPSFSVQNSNIVLNFEDPLPSPPHPVLRYIWTATKIVKLSSFGLSTYQLGKFQLVNLSACQVLPLGTCNLVFVHPKWEIGRQVDIPPLLGHQLTAEKTNKQKNRIKMPDFSGKPQWINYDDLINPRNL